MMSRRTFGTGLCALLTGCVGHTSGPTTGLAEASKSFRPDPASDEAGLWMRAEKEEGKLKTSQGRIRDKALNDYVAGMMCRIAGDRCPDLRTYVLRTPIFNAFCAPNGMVEVCTGLLLRSPTDSHLAAVLGHEFGHYLKRHSIQRLRDTRDTNDSMMMLTLNAAMGGNTVGDQVTAMLARYSHMAFKRDHERESDAIGLQLMADAGYDPFAAAEIWKRLIGEKKSGDIEEHFDIFADTHPPTAERVETLTKLAEERGRPRIPAPNRLAEILAPLRGQLLSDEINVGHFKQTETLFNQLLRDGRNPGEVMYYQGELYRRRGKDGDEAIALGHYHTACETVGAPPEAFRSVGVIRWRRGEKEQAREYFRRYMAIKPDADDGAMINSYLTGA